MKDLEKHPTKHSLDTLPQRKTENLYGNVVGENFLTLKNIFRYILPLMHIIMRLGKNVFNELKRTVIKLDRHSNNTLYKSIAENDLQRCEYLISNYEKGQKN